MSNNRTFLVDCSYCAAKVAAIWKGEATSFVAPDFDPLFGYRLLLGECPNCNGLLAAEQNQVEFEGITSDFNAWSDPRRVFPNPARTFSSNTPKVVKSSITEAQKCIHAGANTAACVMLRRTMEAVCVNILTPLREEEKKISIENKEIPKKYNKNLMLGEGLKELHERKLIDERLFNWGKQVQNIGNKSAHAVDINISRQDVEDLMSFVTALIEYIFDLSLRYNQFLSRLDKNSPENIDLYSVFSDTLTG